ncbi:MAG TPA: hypothetical protein VHW46_00330 [Terracidiphilus sp.]|nr:hypothetical protein [Terracidiphilus sp.]
MTAKRTLLTRGSLVCLAGILATCAVVPLRAQDIMLPGDVPPRVKKHKPKPEVLPPAPDRPPSIVIPAAPLGFGAPSLTYLGRQYSVVALSFVDENRLLFSFRAPGLLARDANESTGIRQMRAVVLKLPDGKVESEALWTIPDNARYLWSLKDGQSLLRDHNGLEIVDASLQMKPALPLSGKFLALRVDPSAKIVESNTLEDAGPARPGTQEIVTRLLDLGTGHAKVSRSARAPSELPINSDGSLEITHDNKYDQWSLRLNLFGGGSRILGHVESTCQPTSAFLASKTILMSGCNQMRVPKLTALSIGGQILWESEAPLLYIPPLLGTTADGSRFIRESIALRKAPSVGNETLWVKAVRGQVVRVFDTASGKVALELSVIPVLDGGGNAALSPSGRRLAVLNHGSIQVFDLPPVSAAPAPPAN